MKFPSLNPHYRTALILIVMAGVLISAALLINRSDFTSAELIVAGLVCLLTGVFFTALSGGDDPIDLRYMSLFSAQNCINLARFCAELGIQGSASIIPKGKDGRDQTMQFLPVAVYNGEPLPTGTFVSGPGTAGLLLEPSCTPLLGLLKEQEHLHIPADRAALHGLVRELGVDVLEVAGQAGSMQEGEIITIILNEYRLIGGCRVMSAESPRCCIVSPCPVCSLFATVFAEGTGKVIQLERCTPDPKSPMVTMVFSVLP